MTQNPEKKIHKKPAYFISLYLMNKLSNKFMEVNNILLNEIETLNKPCRITKTKKSNPRLAKSYQITPSQPPQIDQQSIPN